MSKTGYITARIEPNLKLEAETILKSLGLSASETINILYKQVVLNNGLPFQVKIPNIETVKAINEAKLHKGNLASYSNSDEMLADIWK